MQSEFKQRINYFKRVLLFIPLFINSHFAFSEAKNVLLVEDSTLFSKFPRHEKLSFSPVLKISSSFIRQMFFYKNNIVLTSLDEGDPYVYSLFNPNTKKIDKSFVKRGSQINESVAPLSSGIINNEIIWLHDIALFKVLFLKPVNIDSDNFNITSKILQYPYNSTQLIDDNRIFGYSGIHGLNILQEINLSNKGVKELFGKFENKPDNFSEQSWKLANEGFVFIKPTLDKLVFANKLIDKFYILDTLKQKSISVIGPSKFNLNIEISNIQGRDNIITNETTRRAYINGYCTNRFIYLLHTTKNEMHPKADQGNEIYVFDWNGNPVCKYNFTNEISCFLIDEVNNSIYAFDPDTKEILKGNLAF